MGEVDYWDDLEMRVCREMGELPECKALGLWCDGFLPGEFVLRGPGRHVRGTCWIGVRREQEEWAFKLMLKDHISERSEIYWPYFMPPDDVTGWLRVVPSERFLEIHPRAGRPVESEQ